MSVTQLRRVEPSLPASAVEIIDAEELAGRWKLPVSWIREACRSRSADPLPCLQFGRYKRFRWQSPELNAWLERRSVTGKK